ncbi:hypothetical protein AB0E69_11140 [Kribbella sp. NPDC026611]|uniref:hypothetical protein n=1 Tax=Kribbella sp. NPDC026611 TaxID=3154911 RepID=UPI00340463D5
MGIRAQERIVPISPILAGRSEGPPRPVRDQTISLPWETIDGETQVHELMLPSSCDRARQAVDRRLSRVAPWATEQGRSRADRDVGYSRPEDGPDLL